MLRNCPMREAYKILPLTDNIGFEDSQVDVAGSGLLTCSIMCTRCYVSPGCGTGDNHSPKDYLAARLKPGHKVIVGHLAAAKLDIRV